MRITSSHQSNCTETVTALLIIEIKDENPFSFKLCKSTGPPTNGFEHFGVRVHLKGEHRTRPLSGRFPNAPAAMASRWRFVLFNPLSLCDMPRLQRVADECRAHVVLCPGTRLRARDNREYHTEKLRGGSWALHFGRKRGPCTNSSTGCTMIFSRRLKRHDLYRIVPASAIIAGRGRMVRLRSGRFDWKVQVGTHRRSRRVGCDVAHRRKPSAGHWNSLKKHCRGKAAKHTDSGNGSQLGLGAEGSN